MKSGKQSKNSRLVFSTNRDHLPPARQEEETPTLPPQQQKLLIRLDKKQRRGKSVTLITGFTGTSEDLRGLGRQLQSECGSGGTVKDGLILIQGDFRDRLFTRLVDMGYKVNRSG